MTATSIIKAARKPLKRFFTVGRLRLVSGLVLMVFLTGHLLNHSLGLISLNAMEIGRVVFLDIWRSLPGTILLIAAIAVHMILVFAKMLSIHSYRRLPAREIIQIVMGFAIPPLILLHIVGTRVVHEIYGIDDSYAFVLFSLWVATPLQALLQSAALIFAWVHGCLGVHFWLRLKPWYSSAFPILYSLSLALPILALTGFINGANEVEDLFSDAAWRTAFFAEMNLPEGLVGWAYGIRDQGLRLMIVGLVLLGASRLFWIAHFKRKKLITVSYPDGKTVSAPPGITVLEASNLGNIPHASVCGGRGRCSTCRIRVIEGEMDLEPPSEREAAVLKRVGAVDGTRLACQVKPATDISVVPLLPAKSTPQQGFNQPGYLHGQEKEIAILFADLRSFTKFSEQKLPYDVVFVINQYFRHMGEAIEASGGHLDKFIGDGVMALFGLDDTPEIASQKALDAAMAMAAELEIMNSNLKSDLPSPLRIGIGLHLGQVIVGKMGYGNATSITAIGDAVNTASRLETMNKEFSSQLIFSSELAKRSGRDFSNIRSEEVMVRGREETIAIYVVEDAKIMT
ncbi:adenylate/guanylate cyclase domain-containing protein [Sneathiella marina]|uniref:Adenylate/guanylate cyclase domain-containing protein n=1 Tax=Sneathiella marina TaxID=2950108 RepID=A0ABY4W2W9_9PROT|nr:adenylate/guanylate cyclase domain-containing protein [Sneathiella marina]USG61156.1 adenylate/guanylate cyclase domain-containing protein [Sneathiella marina]